MEISTFTGIWFSSENLVLHCDVSINPKSRALQGYRIEVYKGHPETDDKVQIFISTGTGIKEWSAAFACLGVLLRRNDSQGFREIMDRWLFKCEASTRLAYSISCQIRSKGSDIRIEDTLECISRIPLDADFNDLQYPTRLVSRSFEIDYFSQDYG